MPHEYDDTEHYSDVPKEAASPFFGSVLYHTAGGLISEHHGSYAPNLLTKESLTVSAGVLSAPSILSWLLALFS
eukprot:3350539-Rhodomonas_salina.3